MIENLEPNAGHLQFEDVRAASISAYNDHDRDFDHIWQKLRPPCTALAAMTRTELSRRQKYVPDRAISGGFIATRDAIDRP